MDRPFPDPSQIIDALGGTAVVAKLCEVQPPSVSEWRRVGIPRARLMFLELARPDVDWSVLRGTGPRQPSADSSQTDRGAA